MFCTPRCALDFTSAKVCFESATGYAGRNLHFLPTAVNMKKYARLLLQISQAISFPKQLSSYDLHRPLLRNLSVTPKTAVYRGLSSSATAPSVSFPVGRYLAYAGLLGGCAGATYYYYPKPEKTSNGFSEDVFTVANWSNTHEANTAVYLQPESLEELETVLQTANLRKQKLRPVGSALSPNGIGLSDDGMVSLALMDKILVVNKEKLQVTVQAGARVEQVVEGLKSHGLTLQNFASIKEQQIGGFIQVGAHGTGARLPPVDEQVVSLKLVTPAKGTLDLSPESDPDLFYLARCGLGALGVVAEVTLQCVPRHRLLEYTFVTNLKGVLKNHKKWLGEHQHLRYMWIPDTDAVVVIQCNPIHEDKELSTDNQHHGIDERLKHMCALYREFASKHRPEGAGPPVQGTGQSPQLDEKARMWSGGISDGQSSHVLSDDELHELSFTQLRDILIAVDPLSHDHIARINKAEAEYWKRSAGYRIGWSEEILGFDCGGQQWVSEIALPVGTLKDPDLNDVKYIQELLKMIRKDGTPAPAPIEQRWTASSRSPMSPAYSSSLDTLFSWVGIIMYLPTEEGSQRSAITKKFFEYRHAAARQLWDAFNAQEHWAKIEVPQDNESLIWLQERLKKEFPVEEFNRRRVELDPNGILGNEHIDKLFPLSLL